MDTIYKLKGVVQHYNWGGTTFIPQLLAIDNSEKKPFAEYWLGAHPAAPALLEDENISLSQFIADYPQETLGEKVQQKFFALPYLFKILDVRQMLSIQVHPSKAAAEEEFELENKKGTPLNAPNRNYKDKNHKPELMVALSDFWLLHGFKSVEALKDILEKVPELQFLKSSFANGDYKVLYEKVMTLSQQQTNEILAPLVKRIVPAYQNNELSKNSEDFWAARAAIHFCKDGHYDRGIFSVYFFNLLHLKNGEAIYQAAGLPHAYLEGQNVEVMANSDNVLRGGLTDKHVEVAELMKHVKFEPTNPQVIKASNESSQSFHAPVEEFHLTRYNITGSQIISPETATILFVTEGEGNLTADQKKLAIKKGEAVLLLQSNQVDISVNAGSISAFAVTTPLDKN